MSAWLVINGQSEMFKSFADADAALQRALDTRLARGWKVEPARGSKDPWQKYIATDPRNGFEEIFIEDEESKLPEGDGGIPE